MALAPKKILLADDEVNLRLLVHATIEDSGYTILEASDGLAALQLALEHKPSLVVLDWMMPGKTGVEVTRELRANAGTAEIPIVLLTAKSQKDDLEQGLAAGVNAYLVKPFGPLELLDTVERLLDGK